MKRREVWIVVFLAIILATAAISVAVLSQRFSFPEYIPIKTYAV